MNRSAGNGSFIQGLDVSHYDESVNFQEIVSAGLRFGWAKQTEGSNILDPKALVNRQKAKAAGLLFGGYHFYRPGIDPVKQATWFLKNADLQKGDLRPMLDWEVFQGPGDAVGAMQFLQIIMKTIDCAPIIYGPPYGLNDLKLAQDFAQFPLCVAHYGTLDPLVPAPWTTWSFHQFSSKGSISGVPVPDVDHDRFNGSMEQLLKLTI